jgi:hypothetical protein
MIDATGIYEDDTAIDHLAMSRILLCEMDHDFHQKHGAADAISDDNAEHTRIHDLMRHNYHAAQKLGADINEHPAYKAWKIGYDRIHNPDAPYLKDLDA